MGKKHFFGLNSKTGTVWDIEIKDNRSLGRESLKDTILTDKESPTVIKRQGRDKFFDNLQRNFGVEADEIEVEVNTLYDKLFPKRGKGYK